MELKRVEFTESGRLKFEDWLQDIGDPEVFKPNPNVLKCKLAALESFENSLNQEVQNPQYELAQELTKAERLEIFMPAQEDYVVLSLDYK
jgi:hypothetical protein